MRGWQCASSLELMQQHDFVPRQQNAHSETCLWSYYKDIKNTFSTGMQLPEFT